MQCNRRLSTLSQQHDKPKMRQSKIPSVTYVHEVVHPLGRWGVAYRHGAVEGMLEAFLPVINVSVTVYQ